MTHIKIPETCKPTSEVLYGYSGGMALYVAHWESVLCLFQPTDTQFFEMAIVIINKTLN